MVFGNDALLKIKGQVPTYLKPLLMLSLKTTTLHGCMITKTKTQDAPYKLNMTWLRIGSRKRLAMVMITALIA
jgi:hypothetical protein